MTYEEAVEDCMGYCTNCNDYTRERTEPDITPRQQYGCPICGEFVYGAEEAMMYGLIKEF